MSGAAAAWGGKEALKELKEWLRKARTLGECLIEPGYDKPVGVDDEAAAEALQNLARLWTCVTGGL